MLACPPSHLTSPSSVTHRYRSSLVVLVARKRRMNFSSCSSSSNPSSSSVLGACRGVLGCSWSSWINEGFECFHQVSFKGSFTIHLLWCLLWEKVYLSQNIFHALSIVCSYVSPHEMGRHIVFSSVVCPFVCLSLTLSCSLYIFWTPCGIYKLLCTNVKYDPMMCSAYVGQGRFKVKVTI